VAFVSCPKPNAAVELAVLLVTVVVPNCSMTVQALPVLEVAVTETALPKVRKFVPS
jgi:hypothetical protein